jgi:hypothetical protein
MTAVNVCSSPAVPNHRIKIAVPLTGATNHGQGRYRTGTSGHTSWQVRRHDDLFRSDSQADSAGSIPVTRSTVKPKVSG